jgi:hypothetical protein
MIAIDQGKHTLLTSSIEDEEPNDNKLRQYVDQSYVL